MPSWPQHHRSDQKVRFQLDSWSDTSCKVLKYESMLTNKALGPEQGPKGHLWGPKRPLMGPIQGPVACLYPGPVACLYPGPGALGSIWGRRIGRPFGSHLGSLLFGEPIWGLFGAHLGFICRCGPYWPYWPYWTYCLNSVDIPQTCFSIRGSYLNMVENGFMRPLSPQVPRVV